MGRSNMFVYLEPVMRGPKGVKLHHGLRVRKNEPI